MAISRAYLADRVMLALIAYPLAAAGVLAQENTPIPTDEPKICEPCESWNAAREPFLVFGNTYYVGVAGLSSILVTSKEGHILLDGALPQSAALIAENIRKLGFRIEDIRLIAVSHEHFDHVGGVAALQRATKAIVATSTSGAQALGQGAPTPADPLHGYGPEAMSFPPVQNVRTVADGEGLRVGDLKLIGYHTPGHTPGSTTWTWRSCDGPRCLNVVYADSLNPVSTPGFKFSASPERVEKFRESIALMRELPCDVLLTVHPEFANLDGKLKTRAEQATPDPFIDSRACQAYADAALKSLERRLKEER